jgi:hypothetical protein
MDYGNYNPLQADYMAGCTKVYTKLDPIDAATVGRANTHKMLSWANAAGLVVFVALLTIPVDGKAEWLDDVRGAKGAKVEELYRRHLLELEACGLVISGRNVRKRFKHGRDWVRWTNTTRPTSPTNPPEQPAGPTTRPTSDKNRETSAHHPCPDGHPFFGWISENHPFSSKISDDSSKFSADDSG